MNEWDVRRRMRGALGAAAVSFVAVIWLAVPAAHAAIGFQGLQAKPTNLAAGAHSNVNIHIGFSDPSDQVKDLIVHLPPGLVGDPTATPLCTVAQLNADGCPASTQVGAVTAKVNVQAVVAMPLTVKGSLYNLVPQPGEPARFGIVLRPAGGLLPKIIQQSAVQLRPDFGLDTIINNFPTEASGLETDITSLDIQLFGTANGNGFMRNPTSCTAKTVSFEATSYSKHAASGSAPSFTPTSCAALPFSPTLSVELGERGATRAGSITPLTTVIDQDNGEAGLQNAKVILPSQTGPTAAIVNQCPLAQFQADAAACPAGSIVGDAIATSPFVSGPETGGVVIVEPAVAGSLPRLGVDLHGPLSLQILGSFVAESAGLGNAFVGLPDIPISHFELRFKGGAGGLISTSVDLCDSPPPVFHAEFGGYNGVKGSANPKASIKGCGGGGGGGKPKATVKLKRAHSAHPRMRFKVKAGAKPLGDARLKLPGALRFANGKSWRRGVKARDDSGRIPKSALHHSKRKLTVSLSGGGSGSLLVKFGRHALRHRRPLAHRSLRFPVTVHDIDGTKTSFEVAVHVP